MQDRTAGDDGLDSSPGYDKHEHTYTFRQASNRPMATRGSNERKFGNWTALPHGGRLYFLEIAGTMGWKARYFKEVDASERSLRFWQEIYDSEGRLVEIHEKFPIDKGHRPAGDSLP